LGFHFDDPNNVANAANVASQLVNNSEEMPGLTATAGGDNINQNGENINQNGVNSGDILGATLAVGTAVGFYAIGQGPNNDSQESEGRDIDSQESFTPLTGRDRVIYELQNTLDHVNRQRRVNMSLLGDAFRVLEHRANVLERHLDFMGNIFPDSLNRDRGILDDLRIISARSRKSLLQTADRNIINIEEVYLYLQNPLDILSSNIESVLRSIVPDYTTESDTDEEKISEAVQEHALRFPRRDN
jgi:hypothetical protein